MKTVTAEEILKRQGADRLVLVASRRTDMPRFHLEELVQGLNDGVFHPGPLMNPVFELRFTPEQIHSVGLWSQDFSLWLRERNRVRHDYRYWYRFTILPDDHVIKPVAPSVAEQLHELRELARIDGAGAVTPCIDPILLYRSIGSGEWRDPFTRDFLAMVMDGCLEAGINRVRISFIDYYLRVENRAARCGIEFHYPGHDADDGWFMEKARLIHSMAVERSMETEGCCEPVLVAAGLCQKGACVDGAELVRLFGPGASLKPDTGQRRGAGCGCTRSLDIGRYTEQGPMSHSCGHRCPQCYARRGL